MEVNQFTILNELTRFSGNPKPGQRPRPSLDLRTFLRSLDNFFANNNITTDRKKIGVFFAQIDKEYGDAVDLMNCYSGRVITYEEMVSDFLRAYPSQGTQEFVHAARAVMDLKVSQPTFFSGMTQLEHTTRAAVESYLAKSCYKNIGLHERVAFGIPQAPTRKDTPAPVPRDTAATPPTPATPTITVTPPTADTEAAQETTATQTSASATASGRPTTTATPGTSTTTSATAATSAPQVEPECIWLNIADTFQNFLMHVILAHQLDKSVYDKVQNISAQYPCTNMMAQTIEASARQKLDQASNNKKPRNEGKDIFFSLQTHKNQPAGHMQPQRNNGYRPPQNRGAAYYQQYQQQKQPGFTGSSQPPAMQAKQGQSRQSPTAPNVHNLPCDRCGKRNHTTKECTFTSACSYCHKLGHMAKVCRKRLRQAKGKFCQNCQLADSHNTQECYRQQRGNTQGPRYNAPRVNWTTEQPDQPEDTDYVLNDEDYDDYTQQNVQ